MISVDVAVAAAAQAYSQPPTFVGKGMDQDIHVLRITMAQTIIYAPRGTADPRDVLLDLMVRDVPVTGHPEFGRVHAGFCEAWESVLAEVQADMLLNKDKKFVFVGHSLGGAICLGWTAELGDNPMTSPSQVFLFAPPRVFADFVPDVVRTRFISNTILGDSSGIAFRFGNDPVPDVPGWMPHVPVMPIGKSMANPVDCHHMANYLGALTP